MNLNGRSTAAHNASGPVRRSAVATAIRTAIDANDPRADQKRRAGSTNASRPESHPLGDGYLRLVRGHALRHDDHDGLECGRIDACVRRPDTAEEDRVALGLVRGHVVRRALSRNIDRERGPILLYIEGDHGLMRVLGI